MVKCQQSDTVKWHIVSAHIWNVSFALFLVLSERICRQRYERHNFTFLLCKSWILSCGTYDFQFRVFLSPLLPSLSTSSLVPLSALGISPAFHILPVYFAITWAWNNYHPCHFPFCPSALRLCQVGWTILFFLSDSGTPIGSQHCHSQAMDAKLIPVGYFQYMANTSGKV